MRSPVSVVIALGSNLGDRSRELARAIHALAPAVRVVRKSRVIETAPVDAPRGSGQFLNMIVAGWTTLPPDELLKRLHRIEAHHGRVRRVRNEPRRIDLDLILYGAFVVRSPGLQIPHPRYLQRSFVMEPLRSLRLPWVDPRTGERLRD